MKEKDQEFQLSVAEESILRFVWPSVLAQWIFGTVYHGGRMFVARGVSEVVLSAVNIASLCEFPNFPVSILAVGTSNIVLIFPGTGKHRELESGYNTQNLAVSGVIKPILWSRVRLCPGSAGDVFRGNGVHGGDMCAALYPLHPAPPGFISSYNVSLRPR